MQTIKREMNRKPPRTIVGRRGLRGALRSDRLARGVVGEHAEGGADARGHGHKERVLWVGHLEGERLRHADHRVARNRAAAVCNRKRSNASTQSEIKPVCGSCKDSLWLGSNQVTCTPRSVAMQLMP